MSKTLGILLKAMAHPYEGDEQLGLQIGKLYTDMGFPIDMALVRLEIPYKRKILVLHGALQWLIQHKRNSGAGDKAIERQRKTNRDAMERFINKKETGLY